MNNNNDLLFFIAILGLIIWLIYKLRKSILENKKLVLQNTELNTQNNQLNKENSKLIADNAVLEIEHLKFQLQPHTLGNVVSTLNALAKNLHRGTESLADSLNYILYKGNKHTVSVEEEISFIKKYLQLNQFLNSEIISVRLDDSEVSTLSPCYSNPSIPHLISAYLIENAYKHGDKTHPEFLKITVKLTDNHFELNVTNKLSSKKPEEKIGGLGLVNMEKRLELLVSGKYEITKNHTQEQYQTILKINF
jgi:LytS/YehU family sensor histidine kinase